MSLPTGMRIARCVVPGHDIVVVGASAGGVEALTRLVGALPPDLPSALFVVLHLPPTGTSVLAHILDRSGRLPAETARDGQAIEPGRIYVAPPDHHLLVGRGVMRLTRGPRENGHRPAIDTLFRSAAQAYGNRAVGVVLSGTLDDGTLGLLNIKERGGIAVVQDPGDASFDGMLRSAIENVETDYILPAPEIGPVLAELAERVVEEKGGISVSEREEEEIEVARAEVKYPKSALRAGTPSVYSCPECNGTLWEIREAKLLHFRCRVGHAFSSDTLIESKSESVEEALWTAMRTLDEKVALARRLRDRARERGHVAAERRFLEQADEAERRARLLRTVLANGEGIGVPLPLEVDELAPDGGSEEAGI